MTATHDAGRTSEATAPRAGSTRWMDLARVVATGAVVLIHIVAPVVSGGRGEALTHPRWWLGNVVDSSSRAAVPLFLMISGALLLSAGRHEGAREFYARRLVRVGIPLAFWSAGYLCFRRWALGQDLGVGAALRSVAAATPYFHLYFLFVIVGLYAATPVLRVFLRASSQRAAAVLCAGLFALGAADQLLSSFAGAGSPNAVTRFVPYLGYFVAGHVLVNAVPPVAPIRAPVIAFLGSTGVTAVGTWALIRQYGWGPRGSYLYGYLSPTVITASIAAFLLLRALPGRLPSWWDRRPVVTAVQGTSALTFGVYLVHPVVMWLYPATGPLPTRAPALAVAVAVEWAVVIGTSLLAVWAARKVPLLRRVC